MEEKLWQLGMEVPIGKVDAKLHELWEADEARTNASLMNLAVYCEDPNQLYENSELVRELTREHACRAILIGMDRDAPKTSIRSWITAHCHLAHGRKSICCEQISFLLHGKATGRLRNTVFAHLASDLPLVFWWQGELSDLFEEDLYRLMSRLIFDSDQWDEEGESFRRFDEAFQSHRATIFVAHDLAWMRSYRFRLAIARSFDDPFAREKLTLVNKIRISGNSQNANAVRLLAAWIGVQAGWKFDSARPNQTVFRNDRNDAVTIDFDFSSSSAALSEVKLTGKGLRIRLHREGLSTHLCEEITVDGRSTQRPPGLADCDSIGDLIASQLARGGTNHLYKKIYPTFHKIIIQPSSDNA